MERFNALLQAAVLLVEVHVGAADLDEFGLAGLEDLRHLANSAQQPFDLEARVVGAHADLAELAGMSPRLQRLRQQVAALARVELRRTLPRLVRTRVTVWTAK